MANSIAYATIFQQNLDTAAIQDATTGWMEANASQVVYNGGKTVKVPKLALQGLGDYSRENGYDRGPITLTYETLTMTQDRGKQFLLDSQDVDETNFALNAALVLSEFQRAYVVPEIDAYRISKLVSKAIAADTAATYSYTPAKATILDALKTAIAQVKKAGFFGVPLVCHMSTDAITALEEAIGSGNIRSDSFNAGNGFDTRVTTVDGVPIIETPADRMYSAITMKTTAQGGGYAKADGAVDVNFIVMPRQTPLAISKQDNMKIFEPAQVQDHDAYKVDYRKYHDLWVMDNKVAGIAINCKQAKPSPSGATGATGATGTTE